MQHFHRLRVASVDRLTRDAVALSFAVPADLAATFRYRQGQHITLRTEVGGAQVRRSYSVCAAVQDARLRVAVKRVDGGVFSNWVNDAIEAGAQLDVLPPAGHFMVDLDADNAKHYVAFAAGSGITPILSLVKTTLMTEPRSRFTLFYGNRTASSVLFKEELEDLKDRYLDRFRLGFILSREELDIDLFHGRLDRARVAALLGSWIDAADIDAAFVCGPLDMMTAVRDALQAAGVAKDKIKLELFATSIQNANRRQASRRGQPSPAAQGLCEVNVVLDGRTRVFTAAKAGGNLLDAALEEAIELPYSCKSGVCSSCRCKLTAGEVDMNAAYALEDYEIERGFVLACQSRAVTDRVTLDFDQET